MMSNVVNMLKKFPEKNPEKWLMEQKLQTILEDTDYQAQVSVRLERKVDLRWLRAIDEILILFEEIKEGVAAYDVSKSSNISGNEQEWEKNKKRWVQKMSDWQEKINVAFAECKNFNASSAEYWFAHYSLLKVIPHRKISIRNFEHCCDITQKEPEY